MDTEQIIGYVILASSIAFILGLFVGENWRKWSEPKPRIRRKFHQDSYHMKDQSLGEYEDWWDRDMPPPGFLKREAD